MPIARRRAVLALGLSALAGCISRPEPIDARMTAKDAAEKAFIVVSVSHDRSGRHGGEAVVWLEAGSPGEGHITIESTAGPLALPISNDYRDRYGHVYVFEVPPGHHRFFHWFAHFGNSWTQKHADLKPLEFDVAKGEVLYLGNLHVKLIMGRTLLFNMSAPYAAAAMVTDQSAIDIPIAERRSPVIEGKVRVALLPLGPWGTAAPGEMDERGGAASAPAR